MSVQRRAAVARVELVEALRLLEVPDDLAIKIANRLPYKTAERFIIEFAASLEWPMSADMEERLRRVECLLAGKCPSCGRKVKDWSVPAGSFAPELWATLREHGIDPVSGHQEMCPEKRSGSA